jgi:NADPH2:quinone reductase
MTKAIVFSELGGPEVLRWAEVPKPLPARGEALVRARAIGLNYADTYHRTGLYPVPLPAVPGLEAAGVIEAVGPGVKEFKPGDRVAYATFPPGAYAEARVIAADRLVKLPVGVSFETAAAGLLKGLTAYFLLHRTYRVRKGDVILVHAAAGGVGLILCQWAKALGVTVIGTVGGDAKAKLAKRRGCRYTIDYTRENFVERVREITRGRGVPVVYDGVGNDTFLPSLDCLQPRGMMVSYGNASGAVKPFSIGILAQKGSLFLTRPTMVHYTAARTDLVNSARAVFSAIKRGLIKIEIGQTYPLREAAQAHRDLEARKTTGSTLLLP